MAQPDEVCLNGGEKEAEVCFKMYFISRQKCETKFPSTETVSSSETRHERLKPGRQILNLYQFIGII